MFTTVQCPYCFEFVDIYLEPDVRGSMVQDCEVCCRPWQLEVSWENGEPRVNVRRAQ